VNGGSFGQAISQAAGIAFARRRRGESGRVWVFMSDGEFQEGQVWEAFLSMRFHRIDNLSVVVDVNGQQVDGRMAQVMDIEPLAEKLTAFGACVRRVDGHDLQTLDEAAQAQHEGRPLVILADTNPTQGLPILRDRYPDLHYVRFRDEQERARYREALASY
jgi:transketolase